MSVYVHDETCSMGRSSDILKHRRDGEPELWEESADEVRRIAASRLVSTFINTPMEAVSGLAAAAAPAPGGGGVKCPEPLLVSVCRRVPE